LQQLCFGKTVSYLPLKPENGKPHQEQNQTAFMAGITGLPAARRIYAGRLLKRTGNDSYRQMAAKSKANAFGYRTRLMVHRFFFQEFTLLIDY